MPEVIVHIAAGSVGIVLGYAAVALRKGERLHRLFGTVFVIAMLIVTVFATYLAISLQHVMIAQKGNIAGGILAFYVTASAYMTVRRKEGTIGLFEKVAFAVPLVLAAFYLSWGAEAANGANGRLDGYPPAFYFVFGAISALLTALDLKVIVKGGIAGVQRIERHLWRMCFAFFFATGSFFLGQQKVMPQWMHGSPVLLALALAPLAFMIFWLIRIKLTNWFKRDAMAL